MKIEDLLVPGFLVVVGYYALKTLTDWSAGAGHVVAQAAQVGVQNTTQKSGGALTWLNVDATVLRSLLQGSPLQFEGVPATPEGYLPSNWMWYYPSEVPVKVGLPAGQTLQDFCQVSPGAGSICGDWYQYYGGTT